MALRVANYILGGGGFNSRLMREVRSTRGLAYSVYSYFQVGRHLPGMFIAGSETKSQSTVEVVVLMRQLMRQMMLEPVSEAELELAKKSLINSFVFAFDNNHSIVSRRMRLDYFAYPETYMATYRQKIAAVTVADIQRVANQYLHPDRLQVVLVGDSQQFIKQLEEVDLPVKKIDLNVNE
jgi:zinc protease